MSLTLAIKEKTVEIDGAVFTYKKISFLEQKRILFKYMENGQLKTEDNLNMGYELMSQMIIGWKDIVDEDGNQIDFDQDLIQYLPIGMALKFMERVILPEQKEIIKTKDEFVEKGKQERELENLK